MRKLLYLLPCMTFTGCSLLKRAKEAICGPETPDIPVVVDPQTFILTKTWWLIPAAILGLAGSAMLFAHGKVKTALALAAGAGVGLWLSVSVFSHFKLIGYFGLAIPVAVIGYAIYSAYTEHKELEIDRKAIPELVATTEATKNRLASADAVELFGDDYDHGIAGTIQSPETEEIVAAERKKLK